MIIIETNTGPVMINDREVRGFEYFKVSGEVIVTFANEMPSRIIAKGLGMTSQFENRTMHIKNVEDVLYFGDQCNETYKYQGSEIERLKAEIERVKKEKNIVYNHRSFLGEWLTIYSEALDKIKDSREAERNGKIFKNIDIIIEEAENKYKKSLDEFSKQKL